ncbi:MAG: YgfZ/GcvT domain-containing protein, partial [Burkholderiales bacterium]
HNQLTCDVAALTAGSSTYGSYCTPKGRVLATFLLWRSGEDFFLQLPSPLREPIQKRLTKFILRAKVKATDASGEWTILGVAGAQATRLVQRAAGHAPQGIHEVSQTKDTTVIRLPGDRYEIVVLRDASKGILDSLSDGASKVDPDYWDWLDIHAGVPVILPATQEAFVPQMVNLDLIGGVSLTKGCYPESGLGSGLEVSVFHLPLPPGLVGDFLNGREEILEDRARSEVNLRVDLHAGDEAQLPWRRLSVTTVPN